MSRYITNTYYIQAMSVTKQVVREVVFGASLRSARDYQPELIIPWRLFILQRDRAFIQCDCASWRRSYLL